jgi:phospholipid/cholesterol/gamma-HCH transport system permease protein
MPAAPKPEWSIERQGQDALLRLRGDWLVNESGLRAADELRSLMGKLDGCTRLRFSADGLLRWDSALVAFVWSLQEAAEAAGRALVLDLAGLPEPLRRLLALTRTDHGQGLAEDAARHAGLLTGIGTSVLGGWGAVVGAAELLGATVLRIVPALRGRSRTRSGDVLALMHESGGEALGVITVVNTLVGAILAFVGAVQLQRFGAASFISNLVGIAVIREMAPIMTAIVMAGRTGSAYAAQIATMQGNEEIDALQVLGIAPFDYLVLPRIAALMAMMPVLYFYACLVGLAGGLVVGVAMLSLSPTAFLVQLRSAVPPAEFYLGLSKSVCFGAFIALSSCLIGLRAGRSAADVGRAATDAVVAGIIGIICLDAIFAACADVLGI